LAREQVLDAALAQLREYGSTGLTMRRLAEDLGLGVMTLYNYFRTKDELLDGVCGHALQPLRADPDPDASWEQQLEAAIRELHLVLADNPGVLDVFVTRSVYGPALDQIRETLLGILRRAGFPNRQAVHALGALVSFAVGFTITERARSPKTAPVNPSVRFRTLPAEEFPHLTATAAEYQEYLSEAAFEYGLHHLIDGLHRDLVALRPWSTPLASHLDLVEPGTPDASRSPVDQPEA
jgi:AcrR family transcriptional regulator